MSPLCRRVGYRSLPPRDIENHRQPRRRRQRREKVGDPVAPAVGEQPRRRSGKTVGYVLENAVAAGNPKAVLAEEMYFYRIKKYIGAYAAALGGVDIVVFTGGVGENQASARWGACEGLEFMGIKLDAEKNKVRGEEMVISTEDSQVKVVVIPTDEELMIASDTMDILKK